MASRAFLDLSARSGRPRGPEELAPVELHERRSEPNTGASYWTAASVAVIVVASLFRWGVLRTSALTDTEAYYAAWSRKLALSYYDHPPLVAWTARVGRAIEDSDAGARLPALVASVALLALMHRWGRRLFGNSGGFFAVVGTVALPVVFFEGFTLNPESLFAPLWVGFLMSLDRMRTSHETRWPLLAGIWLGVAFLAKYTALLGVPIALAALMLLPELRPWWRRPALYGGASLALFLVLPVLAWNMQHDWSSARLHLVERVTALTAAEYAANAVRVFTGQLMLLHPVLLPALLLAGGWALVHRRNDGRYRLLLLSGVGAMFPLLAAMVRIQDSEPHWTATAVLPLVVLSAGLLVEQRGAGISWGSGWLATGTVVSAVVYVGYWAHALNPTLVDLLPSGVYRAEGDPIGETVGWNELRADVDHTARLLGPGAVVAGTHNVTCGHLRHVLDERTSVYCASPRRTQFDAWMRRDPPAGVPVVWVEREPVAEDPTVRFPSHACTEGHAVPMRRGARTLLTYRVHECRPVGSEPPPNDTRSESDSWIGVARREAAR